jgi:hypothetical protein
MVSILKYLAYLGSLETGLWEDDAAVSSTAISVCATSFKALD